MPRPAVDRQRGVDQLRPLAHLQQTERRTPRAVRLLRIEAAPVIAYHGLDAIGAEGQADGGIGGGRVALDWPDSARLAKTGDAAPTTATGSATKPPGFSAALSPAAGPILSRTTLQAAGLPARGEVELFWVSARGNRVSPSGWSLTETSVATVTADAAGTLSAGFEIPDDLGGWHVVKVVQGGKV